MNLTQEIDAVLVGNSGVFDHAKEKPIKDSAFLSHCNSILVPRK